MSARLPATRYSPLLKRVLKKRPELRLIVSFATIDAQTFLDFFEDSTRKDFPCRAAPLRLSVDLPLSRCTTFSALPLRQSFKLTRGWDPVCGAGVSARRERSSASPNHWPRKRRCGRCRFTRPCAQRAAQAFEPGAKGQRKVVLATNIAETSLTVATWFSWLTPACPKYAF